MNLFETMRLENGEIPRLQYHINRIQQSCGRLGYAFSKENWLHLVKKIIKNHQQGTFRLKIEIDKTGDMNYVIKPLSQKSLFTAKFQQVQTHYNERYIINKTTERQHLTHDHETDLILLYDEKGKILEFDIGNIMIEEDGTYYTPSYDNDFLLGCMRQSLIDEEKLSIKNYTKTELSEKLNNQQVRIYLLNSLREVADVSIYL